jgi:hypothetical protein
MVMAWVDVKMGAEIMLESRDVVEIR